MNEERLLKSNIDPTDLYKEENYTDLKSGGIRAFVPVNPDGTMDTSRKMKFVAVTNIQTPMGVVPVHATIEDADTLEKALIDFQETLEDRLHKMMEEEMARIEDEKHRIITPDEIDGGIKLVK